ncbi:MAG: winged helix-turn-helix transcriptional regulator [Bacteroidota bacterium]
MSNKPYQQYCAIAQALDVVGQRWTLLIIRELLTGPKRFKALIDQLPGIGSTLLTSRLRDLEQNGLLIHQTTTNQTSYTLTPRGEALQPTIQALLTWGKPLLPSSIDQTKPSHSWLQLALQQAFKSNAFQQTSASYAFIVDEQLIQITLDDGHVNIQPNASHKPDLTIKCTSAVLATILSGTTTLKQGLKAGALQYDGNIEDLLYVFEQLHTAQ